MPQSLIAFALACLTFAPTMAAAQSNMTGLWDLILTTPAGPNTFEVKITQTGDAIAGEIVTPMGNAPFKGTVVDSVLAVTAALDLQGNAINLIFAGKVAGDSASGSVKFGDFGEAPWTGKRKSTSTVAAPAASTSTVASAAPAAPAAGAGTGIAGSWNLEVDLPGNPLPMTGTFSQSGNIVTGIIAGAQGEAKITGTMNGNTFKVDFYAPGGLTIQMNGELKGDTIAGKATMSGVGEVDWTGTRAK